MPTSELRGDSTFGGGRDGLLAALALAVALLTTAPVAEAGNRLSGCGGSGERHCCVLEFPVFDLNKVPCDSNLSAVLFGPGLGQGPGSCSLGTCTSASFPSSCGGQDQRACTLAQHIPSCKSGLREVITLVGVTPTSFCRKIETDGFPTHCGGLNERACQVTEHFPTSCKSGLSEIPFPGGNCIELDGNGFPPACGDEGERPCNLNEHIPSCKVDLREDTDQRCVDAFPPDCGRNGQRPCAVFEYLPSRCKFGLGQRFLDLGECGKDPESWPPTEVPRGGPRTVFFIHGRGGDLSNFASFGSWLLTHRLKFEVPNIKQVYGVDWNDAPGDPARKVRIRELVGVGDTTATCEAIASPACILPEGKTTGTCDGFDQITCSADADCDLACVGGPHAGAECASKGDCRDTALVEWGEFGTASFNTSDFSIYGIARGLSEAIKALPTEANITIVTHSYGGVMGRHLVYRHYDELRKGGKTIAEVVTLAAPHQGGGMAVPIVPNGEQIQNALACAIDAVDLQALGGRQTWHNVCALGLWQDFRKRREGGILGPPFRPVFMDDRDYPQIRWVTVAANGDRLITNDYFTDQLDPAAVPEVFSGLVSDFLALNALVNFYDSDETILTASAFGIQPDECYPFTRTPGPRGLPVETSLVGRVNTLDLDGEGGDPPFDLTVVSAQCHHPGARIDPRYDEGAGLTGVGHGTQDDAVAADFVAAVLSLGGDTDGDGDVDGNDLRPVADAGPDRTVECTGSLTDVILNGSGSVEPPGSTLSFGWSGTFGTAGGVHATVSLPVGIERITLTVDNGTGHTHSDEVVVKVEDTTPPAVDAGLDPTLEATSTSGAAFTLDPRVADLCGPAAVEIAPDATEFPLGASEVTVTVTDAEGNVATDTLTVTVVDTTPPEITPPAGVSAEASAVLSLLAIGDATATDIFPLAVTGDAPAAGFPVGETVVTWTAMDENGNVASATQLVGVVDTTPPHVTAPPAVHAEASAILSAVEIGGALASDIFPVTLGNNAPAGFALGATPVTWTATDQSGNTASAVQTVTIVDTTPPALTLPPNVVVTASGALSPVDIGTATATDIFGATVSHDAPASFPVGLTLVTWTAVDGNGNRASARQRIETLYRFDGFSGPIQPGGVYKADRTLPLNFGLSFSSGAPVTTAVARLSVTPLGADSATGDALDIDSADATDQGGVFRYTGDHYHLNVKTHGWSRGRYRLSVSLDDGRDYAIEITLR